MDPPLDRQPLLLYGGTMDVIKNASETIFKRLVWHTAKRDQAGIAEKLANEQEVHEIYGLGDAGLFDEFFMPIRMLHTPPSVPEFMFRMDPCTLV